jgi:hypothetical protein
MDIPTVLTQLVSDGIVTQDMRDYITQTQFRSFDFVPRVPQWIAQGIQIPGETVSFTEFPDAVPCVWWVDCFGNCKTTLTRENISISDTGHATILGNDVPFYEHLKDVPDNAIALIQGSSGIGNRRFLELVVQGGRASEVLNLKTGDTL